MNVIEKNKTSPFENSSKVSFDEVSQWQLELDFIALEIPFLIQILKSYPFHSQRQNLFERLQLFIQQLEALEEERILILEKISMHKMNLTMKKIGSINSSFSTINHTVIDEDFTNFTLEYQQLKWEIFEYSNTILE